jgi:hypothetical protein
MKKIMLLALIVAPFCTNAQNFGFNDTTLMLRGRVVYTDTPTLMSPHDSIAYYQDQCDSLQKKVKAMDILNKMRVNQAIHYARICQKNPKNIKYLAGWMKVAFE